VTGAGVDTSSPPQPNPNVIMLNNNIKTTLALLIVCLQRFVVESILWEDLPVNSQLGTNDLSK